MLETFIVLLGFQWLGDGLSRWLALPVPGPVLGMLLLLACLLWRQSVPAYLDREIPKLLFYLPLFFVPAGVGLIDYLPLLRQHWWALLLVLIGATLITLLFTAGLLQLLWTRQRIKRLPEVRRERFK